MTFDIAKDVQKINQALFTVTHGLYIPTSVAGGRPNGQCLDALMQVTNVPPCIAIGVGKRSLTHDMIMESGIFAASALDRNDPECYDRVRHFGLQSGRKVDKFAGYEHEVGELGAPILPSAVAFYECRVLRDKTLDLGTHHLFIGELVRTGVRRGAEPLTYNEYRKVMKKGG